MKLATVLIFFACMQVSAGSYGQQITLNEKGVPLDKVFREINRQTGYQFFYKDEVLAQAGTVDIHIKSATIGEVLSLCFRNKSLVFTITEKTIVVRPEPAPAVRPAVVDSTVRPPLTDITGTVTDSAGYPLAGASVYIKGERKGAETDSRGIFVLKAVDDNAILLVSFTGYERREVRLNGRNVVQISLTRTNDPLDEIVVVAYGTTTKRFNTGNVATVTSQEIGEQPVADPLAALEGRVPGLIITQSNGLPGSAFTVQIRGQNSLINGNDPLYLVDGVPYGFANSEMHVSGGANGDQSPLRTINPADIESIDVLKDADATAIYGSRGANGVILITTKKGKKGKPSLNLNVNSGFGKVTRMEHFLNTPQYLAMRREAFANDGVIPDASSAPDLVAWDTTRYTDWQKLLIGGTSHYTDGQLSLSGGSAEVSYILNGGYHRETTVMPSSLGNSRASVRLNVSQVSADKRFNASFTASYSNDQKNLPVSDLTYEVNTVPDAPAIYDAGGKLNWSENGASFDNPLAPLQNKFTGTTDNLIGNELLGYQVLPGLQVKANLGYTFTHTNQTELFPTTSQDPGYNPINRATYTEVTFKSWVIEPQMTYHRTVGKLTLDALAGSTFQEDIDQGKDISASRFTSDLLLSTPSAASSVITSFSYNQYRYNAVFARLTSNWDDKYILNLTGRRDGSSRFGPGRQFADFGALGMAWIFSREKFLVPASDVLSFGKLRFSYGNTGNDKIGNYNYLDTYSPDYGTYMGISGLAPTRLFNPDYAWEANRKLEGGLELGFFRDRLLLTASYFNNRSSNQLLDYALPSQTGFSSVLENFPALIQNTGWEFTLVSTNIKQRDFSWSSSGNLTIARNKLVAFPGLDSSSYAFTYVVGQPLSLRRVFHYTGIDQQTGLYGFSGTYWPNDLTDYKKIVVHYSGGLSNQFTYRHFRLDVFLQFVKQDGLNYIASTENTPGTEYNQPTAVLNRWQKKGDPAALQKFSQSSDAQSAYINYVYYSAGPIADASFIRLKNLALSYTLPPSLMKTLKMSNARVYIQGQNLLTITGYKGADPENQTLFSLPPLRVLTAGIQLTF